VTVPAQPRWIAPAAAWLNPRRLRAHAIVLALCLWGVFATDFATPGFFDRAGNIKFQDFLPFYIAAQLIRENRAGDLFNMQIGDHELQTIIPPSAPGHPVRPRLPMVYGPQVGLLFAPLTHFPFPVAARIFTVLSTLLYFACIFAIWRTCSGLCPFASLVAWAALAFPPFFHCVARGQISALVLACFTAAFLTLRAGRDWWAGIAFGCLIFKPQFLLATLLIFLLSAAWRLASATVLSASAQFALTWMYFGSAVMRSYFSTLLHLSRWIDIAEPGRAPIQMHSLRAFWSLLVPWPQGAFALYLLTSVFAILLAAAVWKSALPLALRFSGLTLAAVLVNPHLFVYDLLLLAPALLLLADSVVRRPQERFSRLISLLLYAAFLLPLFGPLARWTHLQLSVPVFAALLWILRRQSSEISDPQLAPRESGVV
jgi:arabinofuranan 3-O-arabinosyltransferase